MERIKIFLAIYGLTLPFIGLADTFNGRWSMKRGVR